MSKPHEASLSYKRLRELLSYDPETGDFTWLVKPANNMKAGDRAGSQRDAYCVIHIGKSGYMAHRLAWFYIYQTWPPQHLDHINGNSRDNRIANLRTASPRQNSCNWKRSNKSGFRGVRWAGWSYRAVIKIGGKVRHLGYFPCPKEAAKAYDKAARDAFGQFAVTNYQ